MRRIYSIFSLDILRFLMISFCCEARTTIPTVMGDFVNYNPDYDLNRFSKIYSRAFQIKD